MPSRNKVPKAAELVSRSLNWTRAPSPSKRSDMVNASYATVTVSGLHRRYDEQIIARQRLRVQQQDLLWFPRDGVRCISTARTSGAPPAPPFHARQKKSRPR